MCVYLKKSTQNVDHSLSVLFSRPLFVHFVLPKSTLVHGPPNVDGLAMAGADIVACKCAVRGLIYLWDLAAMAREVVEPKDRVQVSEVVPSQITCLFQLSVLYLFELEFV